MNSSLYVRRLSSNLIRDLIGNQCSDLSRGLDSESLLDLVTTRAIRPEDSGAAQYAKEFHH